MATLKIVPKEHWEILRKYLCDDDGESPVLLPEDNLKKFSEENAAILREHDGKYIEYDFGGRARCRTRYHKNSRLLCWKSHYGPSCRGGR